MKLLQLALPLCGFLSFVTSSLASTSSLTPGDEAAAFQAAGYTLKDKSWQLCDDPTPSYTPGTIQEVRDVNGDALPEAVITEGGTFCYGYTGSGYSLVSKQAGGDWKLITQGTGILTFLPTMGANNWPDIEIGGPGFCFPVQRWNGSSYQMHRYQYDGKACRP